MRKWERPDPEITQGELARWLEQYGDLGIGLVLGSPFPDGTRLAALDIDRDDYVRVSYALLRRSPVARIGAKGVAHFVRLRGDGKYRPFKVRPRTGDAMKVGEFLCDRRFCVIPDTIHPETGKPYFWIGQSLLDVSYSELPLVEA